MGSCRTLLVRSWRIVYDNLPLRNVRPKSARIHLSITIKSPNMCFTFTIVYLKVYLHNMRFFALYFVLLPYFVAYLHTLILYDRACWILKYVKWLKLKILKSNYPIEGEYNINETRHLSQHMFVSLNTYYMFYNLMNLWKVYNYMQTALPHVRKEF